MSEANPLERLVSCDELQIISDLVVKLTSQRQDKCNHLSIENFAPDLFARLLYELSTHKKGMIRAEWLNLNDS